MGHSQVGALPNICVFNTDYAFKLTAFPFVAIAGESGPVNPVNIVHGTHAELILFLVLNVWPSHFGLPVLLSIVLFSRKVKRHATFVNLMVAFVIIGLYDAFLQSHENH